MILLSLHEVAWAGVGCGCDRAFESDDPVEEVELGKRSSAPTKASSLPAASNLPPAERPSSDDDAGSAEEWEARDGGGFELRINS